MSYLKPILLIISFIILSCTHVNERSDLLVSLTDYNQAVKWGEINTAVSFYPQELHNDAFRILKEKNKQWRIANYEIERVVILEPGDFFGKGKKVEVTVSYDLLNEHTGELTIHSEKQKWHLASSQWIKENI